MSKILPYSSTLDEAIMMKSTLSPRRRSSVTSTLTPFSNLEEQSEKNEEAEWITKNLRMRKCCKFVQKGETPDKSDRLCHCGYPFKQHMKVARENEDKSENAKWKVDTNTKSMPTNAFGEIEWVGFAQLKSSKYVRLEHTTDKQTVLNLMMDHWGLESPNLLISVTGGAKNFHMRPRLKEVFRRGLMKAAASTGAWIVTGGNHAGVMKHVGEAVQDHIMAHGQKSRVVNIGIAPWGCVNNKDSLVDRRVAKREANGDEYYQGLYPAQYRVENPKIRKQSPIDRNHSHFFFVDNGTQHQFATEIPFRARLERAVSMMKTNTGDNSVSVPVVILVLEGGPGTLETVKSSIQNGIPAVIVEGSGRAADLLAYVYTNSSEEEIEVTDKQGATHKKLVPIVADHIWEEVRYRISTEWDTRDLERRIQWIKDCIEHRDHMTVFRLDSTDSAKDIDVAILQGLLKVNKDQSIDQLKLALAWNRIDVAKSEIFVEDKKWEAGELNDVMQTALTNNRSDFVKLFLENGFSIKDFLTVKRLLNLYNAIPKNSILYILLQRIKGSENKSSPISLEHVGTLIGQLMGEFFKPLYLSDKRYKNIDVTAAMQAESKIGSATDVKESETKTIGLAETQDLDSTPASMPAGKAIISEQRINGIPKFLLTDPFSGESSYLQDFNDPTRELFLWSILLNRIDMAMVFWEEGKDGIAAALTAQKLLMSLKEKTNDSDLEVALQSSSEHFEQLAVGLLSECYSSDERKARLLLVREMESFGQATIIQLAVNADNKTFIAHAACQGLLSNIWMGHLSNEVSALKMWLCVLLPPMIFLVLSYRDDDRNRLSEEIHPKKQKQREIEPAPPGGMMHRESTQHLLPPEKGDKSLKYRTDKKKPPLTITQRVVYFYNAPVITFIHNCLSYLLFLVFYSVVLLTQYSTKLTWHDWVLIVWVFTLFAEEIRQVVQDDSSTLARKFRSYIFDVWNILDMITIVTFILGLSMRVAGESTFEAGHIVLALNLMTFCFRILHIFSVFKELGPKLVMIGRMMVDLAFFVIILSVFIAAFGLASQAILYPESEISFALIRDIFKKPYWQMYGELFLEEIEGENDCSDDPAVYNAGTLPRCPANTWFVPILLAMYILITNVLMLNLLIAMFSNTYEQIQANADAVWKAQHLHLVKEYFERPPLVPPIIIFAHIFLFVRAVYNRTNDKKALTIGQGHGFKMQLTESEKKQLTMWENVNRDEYQRNTQAERNASMESQVAETNERVDTLSRAIEEMSETNFLLQEQMKRTAKALDWIIGSMVEKGAGSKSGPPSLPDPDHLKEVRDASRKTKMDEASKKKHEELLREQLEYHVNAREAQYPCTYQSVLRSPIPTAKVPWNEPFPEYDPILHTDKEVLQDPRPKWADVDLLQYDKDSRPLLNFHRYDDENDVMRESYVEPKYEIKDKIPINPKGRTGICGRGKLGRWGPNHAGDPVVTRWALDQNGDQLMADGKPVFEFVAIQREDTKQWAIPGALINGKMPVHSCLKTEFIDEALGDPEDHGVKRANLEEKLQTLFANGREVYKGYSDDHRNTDNAWIETIAINYHDETGEILRHFKLQAGDTADLVRWMKSTTSQTLYGVHANIIEKTAEHLKAAH